MNDRVYYTHEAEMRAQRERLILAVAAALLGAGIATIVALVFAPKPGHKTRREIGSQFDQILHDARETADKLRDDVEERLQAVRR